MAAAVVIAVSALLCAPASGQPERRTRTPDLVLDVEEARDIAWLDNQDTSACTKKPAWTVKLQRERLLLRTRNFDYQAIPIVLRGDGTASMDRTIQPGRNVTYRVTGNFDGKGRVALRLEDVGREDIRCTWRFSAWHREGAVPGIKGGWAGTP